MKTKLAFILTIAAVTALTFILPGRLSAGEAVHSVTGHGTFSEFGFTDLISINAWSDAAGNAGGMISWETAYFEYDEPSALPGGFGWSGVPWSIDVTSLSVSGNMAYVEGIVVASPQAPGDVGTIVQFLIEDNGNGHNGAPDIVFFGSSGFNQPVEAGNFTVR
jgi:hypothetical protein